MTIWSLSALFRFNQLHSSKSIRRLSNTPIAYNQPTQGGLPRQASLEARLIRLLQLSVQDGSNDDHNASTTTFTLLSYTDTSNSSSDPFNKLLQSCKGLARHGFDSQLGTVQSRCYLEPRARLWLYSICELLFHAWS